MSTKLINKINAQQLAKTLHAQVFIENFQLKGICFLAGVLVRSSFNVFPFRIEGSERLLTEIFKYRLPSAMHEGASIDQEAFYNGFCLADKVKNSLSKSVIPEPQLTADIEAVFKQYRLLEIEDEAFQTALMAMIALINGLFKTQDLAELIHMHESETADAYNLKG